MRITFCVHPNLTLAHEQGKKSSEWLAKRGIESSIVTFNQLCVDSKALSQLIDESDDLALVVALGGDGTILRATRLAYATNTPLLGVNFGHIGFLSGATSDALHLALESFLTGGLYEDRRVMCQADVFFSDGTESSYYALNEVFLTRSEVGKVIIVDISVDGNPLPSPRGDGVIVATASGSTAYALTAGGPLLYPDHQGLCIVPICAFGFNAPALVTAPTNTITLSSEQRNEQHPLLCIDGQTLRAGEDGRYVNKVVLKKAERSMVLLRYDAPDFYQRIVHSLSGGSHAR